MLSQIKSQINNRITPSVIGATAQLSLVVMIFLSQFNVPDTDFVQGLLTGYSIIGNLFFLVHFSKSRREEK